MWRVQSQSSLPLSLYLQLRFLVLQKMRVYYVLHDVKNHLTNCLTARMPLIIVQSFFKRELGYIPVLNSYLKSCACTHLYSKYGAEPKFRQPIEKISMIYVVMGVTPFYIVDGATDSAFTFVCCLLQSFQFK
jgi:hypothetical protein